MPWLSIIMALVSFFLAGGSKPENRAKAAAIGLGVGAATYGVTHYTDWGKENLGNLDGVVAEGGSETTSPTVTKPNGTTVSVGAGNPASSGSTGIWSALGGAVSSPVAAGATGLLAGSLLSGSTLMWIAVGIGAFLILKD